MTQAEKQDAFLKILGRMIGTLTIEPSKVNHMGVGAPRGTQADTFNELMDAAIAKAHEAMEESEKYAEVAEPEREELYEGQNEYEKAKKEELVKTFTAIFEEHDASVLSKTAIMDGLRKHSGLAARCQWHQLLSLAEALGIVELVSDGKTYQRYKLLINDPF